MTNIKDIQNHQKSFLSRTKARKKPVSVEVDDFYVVVNPGVFPPATDTKLLVASIDINRNQRFLDLTTGSGSAAIKAGLQGASGIAVDINPAAIKNAKQNFKRFNVDIDTIQSDLFDNVSEEYFDQIFANGPFFEGEILDPMDYACYGAKIFIENLFSNLSHYLAKNGKLLIVMSTWSDLDHFEQTAEKNSLSILQMNSRASADGERVYNIYQVEAV